MKKSKVPVWPLYVADALMFITVFAIALPSIRYAEDMGLGVAFFCCLMVLGAMGMLLVPYWIEYKKDLATKVEHTQEAEENFKIIFDQLSELQLMIADVEEKREKLEFALADVKSDSDSAAIVAAVAEFKDAVKAKFKETSAAASSNAEEIANLKSAVESKLSALESLISKHSAALEEADRQMEETDATLAAAIADMEIVKDMLSAANESLGDEISQLRAQITGSEPDPDNGCDNLQIGECAPEVENSDNSESELGEKSPAKDSAPKLGSLLQKALGQAEDTKMSVSRLVSMGSEKTNSAAETDKENIDAQSGSGGLAQVQPETLGENPDADSQFKESGETDIEEDAAENSDNGGLGANSNAAEAGNEVFEEGADSGDTKEGSETEASKDKKKSEGFDDDIDFFEEADSAVAKSESASYPQKPDSETSVGDEISDMLFDSLPESPSKPKKPEKGDSVVIVNALIGIGNKPYIRGSAAGLSPDKGTAMEYLEIGKWRYVAKDLSDALNFSIYKNDIQAPEGGNSFTLEAGQKLEIDLSFPQEQ